jgi:hypothetical protein
VGRAEDALYAVRADQTLARVPPSLRDATMWRDRDVLDSAEQHALSWCELAQAFRTGPPKFVSAATTSRRAKAAAQKKGRP